MKRFLPLLLSLLLLFTLLTGCAKSADLYYTNGKNAIEEVNYEAVAPGDAAGSTASSTGTLTESRKLIKTVEINLQTENFDALTEAVSQGVTEAGGYIEHSSLQGKGSRNNRNVSYTLRIPVDRLEQFSSDLSALGVVTSSTSSQEDVTLAYVDLEAHIKALNTERDSLLRLLEQAESVEDIITIQQRISNVQYELESCTSQLRTYDNQIDYATVRLYVYEVPHEDELAEADSVWAQIGKNLKAAVRGIGSFFRWLFVFLISALPYLAVIAAIALPILYFTVFRRIRRRRKAKKQEEQ